MPREKWFTLRIFCLIDAKLFIFTCPIDVLETWILLRYFVSQFIYFQGHLAVIQINLANILQHAPLMHFIEFKVAKLSYFGLTKRVSDFTFWYILLVYAVKVKTSTTVSARYIYQYFSSLTTRYLCESINCLYWWTSFDFSNTYI